METWESVNSIRVVRVFADKPIEGAAIRRIVNAGRRAGSSKNLQRWAFIVVSDRGRLERLTKAGHWATHVAGAAVAIALVTPDPLAEDSPLSVTWDLGRAAQNMILVAWEMGIGSCPATVYDHQLVNDELAIPADHHCEYILAFGYPAELSVLDAPKHRGGRRTLDEVLHEETW